MSLLESQIAKLFKQHIGKEAQVTRIENMVESGTPDSICVLNGCAFFVEFKVLRGNKVTLSPHQYGWHIKCKQNGGICFVLAMSEDGEIRVGQVDWTQETVPTVIWNMHILPNLYTQKDAMWKAVEYMTYGYK